MRFDTSDATYRELLSRVVQSRAQVVPFVGAGLSVYGPASTRLPLWRELLDRLIEEGLHLGVIPEGGGAAIQAALDAGRFIEATDRILDALGEPTFRRVVERELDDRDKPTPPAIAELVAIAWSLIVTTNLDRLIARAYLERHQRPIHAFTSLDTHRLAAALAGTLVTPDTSLAQIHGSIDVYPSWRLTRTHYERLLQDPGYVEALKHLFLRNVFFVGFGVQDDDLDFLLETVARIYPAGVGEFFALIARARKHDPIIQQLVRANGLRPIFYDVDPEPDPDDPFGGHRAVFECLEHLASTWAAAVTEFAVTLKYFPELDPYVVGREVEMDRLGTLVLTETGRLVQVAGLGGVGKTSLVQRFLADRKPDLAATGYRLAFGCSFYRADIGQFVQDMALATAGPLAAPLPQQVDRICEYAEADRMVLVLDGLEAVADGRREVRNPYLLRIVDSVMRGRGAVIATTRVPIRNGVFEHAAVVDVSSLYAEQVIAFLDRWGLSHLGDDAKARLVEVTAGHPLALRIIAGVLRDVPVVAARSTIERSSVIDISDEVDPLRENRLARILGSYLQHLDDREMAFLTSATAFFGPVPYLLVEAALGREYPDSAVNAPLVDSDLRPVVASLVERRLVTVGTGGELSGHPTVREYFAREAQRAGASTVPIHRFLASEYLREAPDQPERFVDALPLVSACRHVAACQDWTLFDDLFRRRLMRGFRNYLCNNLGAWEEGLALAALGDEPAFPATLTPEPAFYPITVARCLKHLGRSDESRAKYLSGLRSAATMHDPDTAKYVNNFLTLLIWRGELVAADRLVELNVRALSWIVEPWKRRWQIEHGYATFGYVRLLQGDLRGASDLFDFARGAWDAHPEQRLWIYDYYPYHRAELTLLLDESDHQRALEQIDDMLVIAQVHGWPESVCRGHVHAAGVYLDRAVHQRDVRDLVAAEERLDIAGGIGAGMNVPDVAIAHLLARFKVALVEWQLNGRQACGHSELETLISRLERLLASSGLALAEPDAVAARGALAYLNGQAGAARDAYERAVRRCESQGNAIAPASGRSIVNLLGRWIGVRAPRASSAVRGDPIGMLGQGLTEAHMLAVLDFLPAPPG